MQRSQVGEVLPRSASARLVRTAYFLCAVLCTSVGGVCLAERPAPDEVARRLRMADFEGAAALLESHGGDCTAERADAIAQAVALRRGLGEDAIADGDIASVVRCVSAAPALGPRVAAIVLELGLSDLYLRDPLRVERHLQEFLRKWARVADSALVVQSETALGALLWDKSCPDATVDGACVRRMDAREVAAERKRTHRLPSCGNDATVEHVVVRRRDPALVASARAHLARALVSMRAGARGARAPAASDATREARAEAQFLLVESEYERVLGLHLPDGLDFTPVPERGPADERARARALLASSRRRFASWVAARTRAAVRSAKGSIFSDDRDPLHRHLYARVRETRSRYWGTAALARMAQLDVSFGDELSRMPQPRAPPAPAGIPSEQFECIHDSFCDILDGRIGERDAIDALQSCSAAVQDLGPNRWSSECDRLFDKLRPADSNLVREIMPTPGYANR